MRVLKPHQVKAINKQVLDVKDKKYVRAERENSIFGFIGTNRVGKTSIMELMIKHCIANNPDATIIAFDPQRRFSKYADFLIYPYDMEDAENKILNIRNGILIFDDIREFHPKNIPDDWLLKLCSSRCDWNVDIYYAIHNPGLLLNALAYYTTHYFIFYTQVQSGTWNKKIPNYVLCNAAAVEVNKYVTINGKGDYPNFPHIIVNNQTQELIAQNMKYE